MARFFKLISVFFLFFFMSCQEGKEAGRLLGQWRLAGSESEYISFSGSISLLRSIVKGNEYGIAVYGNFQHIGDSLFIQCYSAESTHTDTVMVEETFGFKPFNDIRVKIETLNEDVLVLAKDNQTWSFYKY